MNRRRIRVLSTIAAALFTAAIVALVAFEAGPIHAASCFIGGRDGWFVEYPQDLRTPDDVVAVIHQETSCVPIEIGYVDWNRVPEGNLAIAVWCRDCSTAGCRP